MKRRPAKRKTELDEALIVLSALILAMISVAVAVAVVSHVRHKTIDAQELLNTPTFSSQEYHRFGE